MNKNKTLRLFRDVRRYSDLQEVYVKYLKGEIKFSPDQAGPVNHETIPLLDSLIKINELGLITVNGQPSKCEYGVLKSYEQKSYITGFMEKKYLQSFMEYVQNQNEFYYSLLNYSNESIVDIFPSKRYK